MTVNLPVPGKLLLDEWGIPLTQQCNDHDTRVNSSSVLLDARRVTNAGGPYSNSGTDPQEHVKLRSGAINLTNGRSYRFSGQLLVTFSVGTDIWSLEIRKGSSAGTIVGGGQIEGGWITCWDAIWQCTADETAVQFYYMLNRSAGAGTIGLYALFGGIHQTNAQIYEIGANSLVVDVP